MPSVQTLSTTGAKSMLNYNEAMDEATLVPIDEAMAEIVDRHNHKSSAIAIVVKCHRQCLVDTYDNCTIASIDGDGMVHALDVMQWLGY